MSPNTMKLEYQPRIHIAVDRLDIVDGPGAALLTKGEGTYSYEQGVRTRFTVMTPASDCPTTVKAVVYAVASKATPETQFNDELTPSGDYSIECLIGGWRFFGTYNPSTRTGILHADIWDPSDPTDGRNWD